MSEEDVTPLKKGVIVPCIVLAFISLALGLGVEGISGFVTQAAETLLDPSIYIDAVLYND